MVCVTKYVVGGQNKSFGTRSSNQYVYIGLTYGQGVRRLGKGRRHNKRKALVFLCIIRYLFLFDRLKLLVSLSCSDFFIMVSNFFIPSFFLMSCNSPRGMSASSVRYKPVQSAKLVSGRINVNLRLFRVSSASSDSYSLELSPSSDAGSS